MSQALIESMRAIARAHGWALGVHGSLIRDIDLIAVPWTDEAAPWTTIYDEWIAKLPLKDIEGWHRRRLKPGRAHNRRSILMLQHGTVRVEDGNPKGTWSPPAIDVSFMPRTDKDGNPIQENENMNSEDTILFPEGGSVSRVPLPNIQDQPLMSDPFEGTSLDERHDPPGQTLSPGAPPGTFQSSWREENGTSASVREVTKSMLDPYFDSINAFQDWMRSQPFPQGKNLSPLALLTIGLAGETGEAIELLKKHMRDGTPLDMLHFIKELGDIMIITSCLAAETGLKMSDVLEAAVEKVKGRIERGTMRGAGDDR